MAEFLIYSSDHNEYHWYLVADGGSKIAGSEKHYETREKCEEAIELVRRTAANATIVDRTNEETIEQVQARALDDVERPINDKPEPAMGRRR
ncbi:MAG: YegP family protein [Actinomycetota bacterium]|nr:DUF1508 domain-containing protein [Actinomycetota bacterium]